jgi:hypothetical protein
VEYYCNNGSLDTKLSQCEYGCDSGHCLCEDSDDGISYYKLGTTSRGDTDCCINSTGHYHISSTHLREYFVRVKGENGNENYNISYVDVECPDGCENGICKKTCSDRIKNQNEIGIDCGDGVQQLALIVIFQRRLWVVEVDSHLTILLLETQQLML